MLHTALANTHKPPYYAVVFSSRRNDADAEGYAEASARMIEVAEQVPGFIGVESARDTQGSGITVSCWTDEAAISAWKRQAEHAVIRERGRWLWYRDFNVRVARVERAYGGSKDGAA